MNVSGRNVDISKESVNELEDKPEDMSKNAVWREEKNRKYRRESKRCRDTMSKSSTHLTTV